MFKAWGGGVGKGREQGGWVACFITPQWLFMLLNLKFLSIPRWHIFFCVVKRMFLMAMHILYWFTPTFLQKEKKNQKSTCLNKKISMFKVVCRCDLIKKHGFTL